MPGRASVTHARVSGTPVDAAAAFPANADSADRSFRVAGLIDAQATLTGVEQSRSDALPFAGRYRLAFKTELESGRHVQPGRDSRNDSARVFSWTDKVFLTGIFDRVRSFCQGSRMFSRRPATARNFRKISIRQSHSSAPAHLSQGGKPCSRDPFGAGSGFRADLIGACGRRDTGLERRSWLRRSLPPASFLHTSLIPRRTPAGNWSGFAVEMAKDVAKSLHVDLEYVETSFKTVVLDLQSGKCQVFFGFNATPERALAIDFAGPLYTLGFRRARPAGIRGEGRSLGRSQ